MSRMTKFLRVFALVVVMIIAKFQLKHAQAACWRNTGEIISANKTEADRHFTGNTGGKKIVHGINRVISLFPTKISTVQENSQGRQ